MEIKEIPFGYCHCGCGNKTNLWTQSYTYLGVKKGDPRKFIKGHYKKEKIILYATCHPDRIARTNGLCGSCYNKSLYDKNPEKRNEMLRRNRERAKLKPHDSKKNIERQLKSRYKIDLKQYENLLQSQSNGCAICGKKTAFNSGIGRLHVDHCHKTGIIRGLLCSQCNTTLGNAESIGLGKILSYLYGENVFMELGNQNWDLHIDKLREQEKCQK